MTFEYLKVGCDKTKNIDLPPKTGDRGHLPISLEPISSHLSETFFILYIADKSVQFDQITHEKRKDCMIYIFQLKEKDQSYLDERIKRSSKNRPPPGERPKSAPQGPQRSSSQ